MKITRARPRLTRSKVEAIRRVLQGMTEHELQNAVSRASGLDWTMRDVMDAADAASGYLAALVRWYDATHPIDVSPVLGRNAGGRR